ncbi:glycosyltransferase [Oscillatoria amoena NRMC-F 0135]|nr:glycosyltransferase [Oscillatoria amoena NRMC-F 0135]MDL5052548.1 glycosyltransferase [Oscillatoria laete-virens NRMC-F 0139]
MTVDSPPPQAGLTLPMTPRGRIKTNAKFFFRGGQKFFVKGVTYGPFKPYTPGVHLHSPDQTRQDMRLIHDLGANVLRLYHVPPRWFLDMCQEYDLHALITIPWEQHTGFLDTRASRQSVMSKIRSGVRRNAGHPAIFGYMVGNEIPASTVRWYGLNRVRSFLETLVEIAKEEDEKTLVTYANFPSTEYLIPSNADFCSYNVYLENPVSFEKYLARLQNLAGEKPLMLGEFGLDTIRNGEDKQAETLAWHVQTVGHMGLAGTILFAWTDDWFTGEHQITDWAFGLVDQDRNPKKSYHRIQDSFKDEADGRSGQRIPLKSYPRVSVVVCSYNGAKTLDACLQSLTEVDYPDYEIILVDDGSTDRTPEIAREFPHVRHIRQVNKGLSYARNVGWQNATGEIVAYTDSDCMADRDWLYYMVATLTSGQFAGVGGPNISPPAQDWIQACVAAAPGSPSHVLVSDTVAEHVPGCNMAFWRYALEGIGGWDIEYRKAGDDVDFCWRLQQAGYEIAFSPSAIVWHHRRFTVQAFFKQQAGYGEAEALLRFKHLIFFTPSGNAKWRGIVYGLPIGPSLIKKPIIYHGIFGMGLFQSIYPSDDPVLLDYAGSIEWVLAALGMAILAVAFPVLIPVPLVMLGITIFGGLMYAARARLESRYDTLASRCLLWFLAVCQPLVRGYNRHYTWISHKTTPSKILAGDREARESYSFTRDNSLAYWSEDGVERDRVIEVVREILDEQNWSYSLDTGWTDWDIQIYGNYWWDIRLRTQTENHGGNKRLIRVQTDPKMTPLTILVTVFTCLLAVTLYFGFEIPVIYLLCGASLVAAFLIYWAYLIRGRTGGLVVKAATSLGLIPIRSSASKEIAS